MGSIIRAAYVGPESATTIYELLRNYAHALVPWARKTAELMLREIDIRSRDTWRALSQEISLGIRRELESAPIGLQFHRLLASQVELIRSLPLEAAERVHRLTTQALPRSTRALQLSEEILRTGEVTKSRAILIARTETSRAATTFVQARAEHVGSTQFIWRTSLDGTVRESHRRLEGKVFRWDDPPECDPGHHALPGAIWNCRCWAEPLLADIGGN